MKHLAAITIAMMGMTSVNAASVQHAATDVREVDNYLDLSSLGPSNSQGARPMCRIKHSTKQPNAKNWIGIYRSNDTPGRVGATQWSWATGTGRQEAGLDCSTLKPGSYKAYYLVDEAYRVLVGPVEFTIGSGGITQSNAVNNGDILSVDVRG